MNKAKLKSYYANGTSVYRKDLENKIIVYNEHLYTNSEDIFLISNGVSIIALNNDFGMEKVETNLGNSLSKIFNDFTYNFTLQNIDITDDILSEKEKEFNFKENYATDIKENEITNYGVNMKLFNIIKGLIKGNKVSLLTKYSFDYNYVIKIENTKTNEVAYLLPIRTY